MAEGARRGEIRLQSRNSKRARYFTGKGNANYEYFRTAEPARIKRAQNRKKDEINFDWAVQKIEKFLNISFLILKFEKRRLSF